MVRALHSTRSVFSHTVKVTCWVKQYICCDEWQGRHTVSRHMVCVLCWCVYMFCVEFCSICSVLSYVVHVLCWVMYYMFCVESYGANYIETYTFRWPVLHSIFQLIKLWPVYWQKKKNFQNSFTAIQSVCPLRFLRTAAVSMDAGCFLHDKAAMLRDMIKTHPVTQAWSVSSSMSLFTGNLLLHSTPCSIMFCCLKH